MNLPENLRTLHAHEEALRSRAEALVAANPRLALHLLVVERAMDLADLLRQYPSEDEGRKVVQALGMRVFNAFCASIKLALSGYGQNSALVLRDIVETGNLLDLFSRDANAVARFRFAGEKAERTEFSPVKVRIALDRRDGRDDRRREKQYRMLSELAAHPTMQSGHLMRPRKDADLESGRSWSPSFSRRSCARWLASRFRWERCWTGSFPRPGSACSLHERRSARPDELGWIRTHPDDDGARGAFGFGAEDVPG